MKSYSTSIILFIVIILVAILQMTVFSRLMLLHGAADIVLLTLIAWSLQENGPSMWPWTLLAGAIISFASALPFMVPLPGYLLATGVTRLTQRRIWQSPLLAMLLVTLVCTILFHLLSMAALFADGTSIHFQEAWTQVTMPSLLLNLLLAIPVYAAIHSIHEQMHPIYQQT
jgi:cell shape-determining protein MreD